LQYVLKTVITSLLGPTEEKGKGKAIAVEEEEEEVKRLDSIADYVAEQSERPTNHTFPLVHLIHGSPH
jgi:hypothetical protein